MPKDQTYSLSSTPSSEEESIVDFYDEENEESEEGSDDSDEEQESEYGSVDEELLSEDSYSMLISMQEQQNSEYIGLGGKLFALCNEYDNSDIDITADDALQWIHREQPTYTEEFTELYGYSSPIEYPNLDCEKLAGSLSDDDFVVVINNLLDEYIDAEKPNNYQFISPYQYVFDFKTLRALIVSRTEVVGRNIEYDINLIDRCCVKAIENDDIDEFNFFYELSSGSSEEMIFAAIKKDAREFLDELDPRPTQEYVQFAIKNKSEAAIEYFFSSHDFADTSELVLSMAIEKLRSHQPRKAKNLVRKVCHFANLEHTYDLILFLVKKGGESLIEIFFKSFEVKELLTEIQGQDGDRGLLNVVLEETKAFVAQQGWERSEIETLISQFDGTLRFTPTSLIYPAKEFEGEPRLAKIRKIVDNDFSFSEERRTAASLIGIRLCTTNHYLNSKSPYHPSDPQTSEAYFRSSHHPLSILVGPNNARYSVSVNLPEANAKQGYGCEAHMGLYKHPVDSLTKSAVSKKTSEGSQQENTFSGDGAIYNRLLYYKLNICRHIATMLNFEGEDNGINVGFYNNYPCVMVFIETPKSITQTPSTAAKKAWTEIIISYFIGLANNLAHKKGIDLELTRRSGFGFLTPTIAPCEQSFRLNVGMIPLAYADVLIECLKILNNVLKMLNAKKLGENTLNLKLSKNCFVFNQKYKDYCNDPESNKKQETLNILNLAWEKVDRGGRTSAFNLMRTSIARDGLAAEVFNALAGKDSVSTNQYTQILLDALRWGFDKLTIINERLRFNKDVTIQLNLSSSIPQIKIEDQRFFSCVSFIIKSIQKNLKIDDLPICLKNDIEKTIKNIQLLLSKKNIKNLYFYLQLLNELFYACSIYSDTKSTEDDFGSDSEVEIDVSPKKNKTRIYGKKLIVPNGMRAIIDALHASASYLYPDYLTADNIKKKPLFLYGPYYETARAMGTLAKFDVFTKLTYISRAKILIHDLNACIETGKELPAIKKENLKNIEILILDSTSSTLERYQHWIGIFKRSPNMRALFFVSSGFKNEQIGADKNPYGTIRCYTKDKNLLNNLLSFIKETEKPISSAVSHDFRRLMKTLGGVPCNSVIVTPKIKKSQTARRNKVETKTVAIERMAIDTDSTCSNLDATHQNELVAHSSHFVPLLKSNQYSETLLVQSNKHSQFFKPRNNTNIKGENLKSIVPIH